LLGGILVVLALYAAFVGIVALRRLAFGMWGLGLFAFIGLWAALTRPGSTADYLWPTLAGAAAGAFTLARLTDAARRLSAPPARPRPQPGPSTDRPAPGTPTPPDPPGPRAAPPPRPRPRPAPSTDGPGPETLPPPDLPVPPAAPEPGTGSSFTFLPDP